MVLKLGVSRKFIRQEKEKKFKVDKKRLRELMHDAVMGILGDDALRYLG